MTKSLDQSVIEIGPRVFPTPEQAWVERGSHTRSVDYIVRADVGADPGLLCCWEIAVRRLLAVAPSFVLLHVMGLDRDDFTWRGLALCVGRGKTPVLTLVADADYPHLYRIRYPNGWTWDGRPENIRAIQSGAT